MKCMNDWLENGFESDSYEEASDAEEVVQQVIDGQLDQNESEEDQQVIHEEVVQQVIEQVIEGQPDQNESEEDQQVVHEQAVQQVIEQFIEGQLDQNESEEDQRDIEDDEQRHPVNKSTDTIIDVEGTVHDLPSASRLASNTKMYAEARLRNNKAFKPCRRCSFPCGMRSRKCQDKDECTFVMIKAKKYKSSAKPAEEQRVAKEKRHDAAVLRLKADYDKVVDSQSQSSALIIVTRCLQKLSKQS